MKEKFIYCLKSLAYFSLVLCFVEPVLAQQKLNNIQKDSFYAPTGVRIDGNTAEWEDKYQAFNKATGIYYSIANDSTNLYLVIKSGSQATTNKIMRGGITFKVSAGKKDGGQAFLFPVPGASDMRKLNQAIRGSNQNTNQKMSLDQIKRRADSIMAVGNARQIAQLKEIKIDGIPSITDSVISIYNEYGIKAGLFLSHENVLTYELAVPIKLLGLAEHENKIAYNIRLNGMQIRARAIPGNFPDAGGTVTVFKNSGPEGAAGMSNKMAEMRDMTLPTDVSGKYAFIKK